MRAVGWLGVLWVCWGILPTQDALAQSEKPSGWEWGIGVGAGISRIANVPFSIDTFFLSEPKRDEVRLSLNAYLSRPLTRRLSVEVGLSHYWTNRAVMLDMSKPSIGSDYFFLSTWVSQYGPVLEIPVQAHLKIHRKYLSIFAGAAPQWMYHTQKRDWLTVREAEYASLASTIQGSANRPLQFGYSVGATLNLWRFRLTYTRLTNTVSPFRSVEWRGQSIPLRADTERQAVALFYRIGRRE